jgi:hypothetical protein
LYQHVSPLMGVLIAGFILIKVYRLFPICCSFSSINLPVPFRLLHAVWLPGSARWPCSVLIAVCCLIVRPSLQAVPIPTAKFSPTMQFLNSVRLRAGVFDCCGFSVGLQSVRILGSVRLRWGQKDFCVLSRWMMYANFWTKAKWGFSQVTSPAIDFSTSVRLVAKISSENNLPHHGGQNWLRNCYFGPVEEGDMRKNKADAGIRSR